ncbi:hypothetical protein [Bacillus sp. 2205SS5-2]|uniref:hypothetical protein n=1 Tax=Bacillus sp. 2205SS5-2 TaxID=3109031 RepID=UPI003005A160
MRVWRVGTVSMGASLVFLGISLSLSQIFKWDVAYILVSWWPVLLIVLGIEILLYLFLARSEKPRLKYDFLSILFVAILGMVGIGFTTFQATGFLDQAQLFFKEEVTTATLPAYSQDLKNEINRVVISTGNHPITIENSTATDVSIFGTYRSQMVEEEPLLREVDDYLLIKVIGDTMYVSFKELPQRHKWINERGNIEATVVIPSRVAMELDSEYGEVTLKPRRLLSSWNVSDSSNVALQLSDTEDLTISLQNVDRIQADELQWSDSKAENANINGEESLNHQDDGLSTSAQLGSGKYSISIANAGSVTAMVRK